MDSFAKVFFVISVGLVGVGYGVLSNQWKIFPSPQLRLAWNQAEIYFGIQPPNKNDWGRHYDREGVRLVQPGKMQPGLTLVDIAWPGATGDPSLSLINKKGEVIKKWGVSAEEIEKIFPEAEMSAKRAKIHGSILLENGSVVFNLPYFGTIKMDGCGTIEWKQDIRSHHSISMGNDGSFWVPGVKKKGETPEYPGLGKKWGEQIIHIDKNGEVLNVVNVLDVIFENGLERRMAKTRALKIGDLTHINDVEPLNPSMSDDYPLFESGDLVMSLRSINQVIVFDPETEEVKWSSHEPFVAQHDPDFTGGGWIGVLDNNSDWTRTGEMLGGSRIISVQPHTDSVRVRFPTQYSDSFYTMIQGKWQNLENGNMLLSETVGGRVVEVGPEGRTIWEFVEPGSKLTKAIRHDLTQKEVSSWPCSSIKSVSPSTQSE